MKKTLAFILSMVLVMALFVPVFNASADAQTDWVLSQPDGTILFVPNFNGEAGVYEPGYYNGDPVVTVDPNNPNTITVCTKTNKKASWWGGFIDTLPLNEQTCYTIYYTVTRTGNHAIGVYCDPVYGIYGYPAKTRILKNTSNLPGHDYIEYATMGIDAPVDADPISGEIVQEFVLEVNGVNQVISNYIKDKSGTYVLVDESKEGEIEYFNADVLGLFFYSYYEGHIVKVSDISIAKGLAFGKATAPETTPAPDTTKAPETEAPDTTVEPDTTAEPDTEAPDTQAPAQMPDTTAAPAPAEPKGCGAAVSAGFILTAIAAAFVICKRK